MTSKQRLELTWIGKENRPRLEPRILLEDPEKSYHAKKRVTDNDIFDNRLIFGDNLLALKALEQEFAGKVKCVFIDPPYNTGSAFEHYDDGVEHSIWLSLIRDRLELLHRLLSKDGSLWITIDDNEAHYLKVLCDEVFGRGNFIANIVWQKRTSRENRAAIGSSHDHILIYAKMPAPEWKAFRNKLPANDSGFGNPDNDLRGPWRSIPFSAQGFRENQMYKILTPTGKKLDPPKGRCWGATEPEYKKYEVEGRVYFPKGGDGRPRIKLFRGEEEGLVPMTWWSAADCGDTEESKKEILALYPDQEPFGTPKPERLLKQIITIATKEGDLILDSFAGSGTTGAVAQKMKRRWIMVELGEHAYTHIIPRLNKVIDGTDLGGVTEAMGWKGGGGFRSFHLAPSLLDRDRFGNLVISKQYNAAMLAEAMCKVMGFTYAPSEELYWQQGRSNESDFLYVTTQTLTREQLAKLSDEVGGNRSLLICCAAFRGKADVFANLTVKKIPSAVLAKCEWGHDDYSLNVANLPKAAPPVEVAPANPEQALTPKQARRRAAQPSLFATDGNGGAE
ncbi:MAG: putative type restriction-modification system methyltransferase [Acidobacteriaceae bacterium]|nr:putative type restriction-modification system methyltransferase [Acidobacteriaceae bacterium]